MMGRCRTCKGCVRVQVVRESERRMGAYGRTEYHNVFTLPNGQKARGGDACRFHVQCLCGERKYAEFNVLHGVVTQEKCSVKCTGAKGHDCECACGGKNHGCDHDLGQLLFPQMEAAS